jgi:hypothetical protein
MDVGPRGIAAKVAAAVAGSAVAAAIATAAPPSQTVTLGSTTGNPSANICVQSIDCTYVPFSGASAPELQVPFDGKVTSFSVNSGSAVGTVQLRVLRPAGGGKFTGAGTGPSETLNTGTTTFTVSLPVKAGDVIGLDNSSSALMFDTTSPTAITAYYELPPLADGATGAPNHNQSGYRLLLSATVQSSTTTGPTGNTGPTGPAGTTGTPPAAPRLTDVRQSHPVWREGSRLATSSRKRGSPVGTTFSFGLNEPAQVSISFIRHSTGRRVHGKCRPQVSANRSKLRCQLSVFQGSLRVAGHAGANQVRFQGRISRSRRLPIGSYSTQIIAVNAAGQRSSSATLAFTIAK